MQVPQSSQPQKLPIMGLLHYRASAGPPHLPPRMAKVKAAPLPETSTWTLGLINSRCSNSSHHLTCLPSSRNYLTAEKFGFKINANGKTMKKNQMWELEGWGDGKTVCLKSSLGRFMAVDKHGNVRCGTMCCSAACGISSRA